jgi:tetratricopeptide (TPR) repeat protein
VGRTDDLCALKAHLIPTGDGRARTQILTAIKGWPGVGKTTVAAALAHDAEIAAAFPEGVLWTSLGPTPNVLSELAAWGRALDIDLTRADSIEQACAALAALLRDARRLLIVDDVWQAEHAQPFKVGGRNCATLLTTRHADVARALAPAAQDIYLLPVLTETESLDLLRELAPEVAAQREPACRELARVLDGLPLALQVAGRLLNAEAERGFGVDELLAELRAGERILQERAPADRADVAAETTPSVAALLRKSTDCLDEPMRAAFAHLGAFPPKPATFDLGAVQAVCEADDAEKVVRTLVDRGLLEAAGGGRWQLHTVLILHARSLLNDEECYAAQRRHAGHYEKVLRAARTLYEQGGESILRGLGLFDLEWGNIAAGQAWAAGHAEGDDAAARLCSDYPDAGAYVLDLRQHARERIGWLEVALVAARRLKDRGKEGGRLGSLGQAYADLGDARKAIEYQEQRLVIVREIGDRRGEGNALGNLGLAYADLGEARKAIEFYEQYRAIAREIGDRRGEGNALGNLGSAYADLGDASRAIEYHEQALVIDREIGDRRGEGADLGNLGLAYADLGDVRKAIEYHEQALVIDREIGDRRGEALDSWNLGLAYEKEGDLARAAAAMQVCVDYEQEIGHPDAEKDAARVEELRGRLKG